MVESNLTSYSWAFVSDRVPVNVMKCGDWKASCEEKSLFFIIPGNPGCMGFYQIFAESLFKETGIPVWGISHTGQVTAPKSLSNGYKEVFIEHPDLGDCGLTHQIEHKAAFLKNEVLPKVDKVYLIGHSIGCYMILHVLDKMKESKLQKGIMLFPTIEKMALTPKGQWMTPLLVNRRWWFDILTWSLSWFPYFVKRFLVDILFVACNEPSKKAVLDDVISPKVAKCSAFLGMQEMLTVHGRDDHIIKSYADKLHFYYGAIDHWCPVSFYEDMKRDHKDIDIQLCKRNFRHAFVLREAEEMATIVANMTKGF